MVDAGRTPPICGTTMREQCHAAQGPQAQGLTLASSALARSAYMAPLALALGRRVLVHDPYKRADGADGAAVSIAAGVRHFVVPLRRHAETENLIGRHGVARMKHGPPGFKRRAAISSTRRRSTQHSNGSRSRCSARGGGADQMPSRISRAAPT